MRAVEGVVCGAGIAGAAAAYELAVVHGITRLLIVDPLSPLSLTSDKSTECYRNWWPGPGDAMLRLMNRSIDRLERLEEASGGRLAMNRRGYAYLTADRERAREFERSARATSALGAGELRIHRGGAEDPRYPPFVAEGTPEGLRGADLLLDPSVIRSRFPFLAGDTLALLHTRRCGWLAAQQLGMVLLEAAREAGAELIEGRVAAVEVEGDAVVAVAIEGPHGRERLATRLVVNAAGPMAQEVGRLAGVELPLLHELHGKVTFDDHLGVVPRELPLMIWCDPVALAWNEAERRDLAADPELAWLLEPLPAGVHFRPEGGAASRMLLLLWTYHLEPTAPRFPPEFDPLYPEVVLRGLVRMIPGLAVYLERGMRKPYVDGGYYAKTRENRPLVGPTPVAGFQLLCGLSGFGIMAALGAAELLGAHVTGSALPSHAGEFLLARYDDPDYLARLPDLTSGQL